MIFLYSNQHNSFNYNTASQIIRKLIDGQQFSIQSVVKRTIMQNNNDSPKREGMDDRKRCWWANTSRKMQYYHDSEWNVLIDDDNRFFEFLCIEIMQAGLSFETIIQKREALCDAFDNFDFEKISQYDENKIRELMKDKRIVRNRKKIEAVIYNAKRFSSIVKTYNSFLKWFSSRKSEKDNLNNYIILFKENFRFVGPEIVREFLESSGLITKEHDAECFMHKKKES